MTQDEYADWLAELATDLVVRVRDEDPADVHRWIANTIQPADMTALAVVLAAAVPDDRSWLTLTAWTTQPRPAPVRELQPHGTRAAARRHRAHGEDPCTPCTDAERAWDRARKRATRQTCTTANQPQEASAA